jgi:hypothetical protein
VHYYANLKLHSVFRHHHTVSISDVIQVVAARSDASSSLTTRMFAQNASRAAAGASIKNMPIPKSLLITGRTFVSEYQD